MGLLDLQAFSEFPRERDILNFLPNAFGFYEDSFGRRLDKLRLDLWQYSSCTPLCVQRLKLWHGLSAQRGNIGVIQHRRYFYLAEDPFKVRSRGHNFNIATQRACEFV
ncbi:hypothetical protein DZD52_20930 [Xanthomonas nasturtii]|uniref:Uncharacterized protein n=1 Tax=Xanthomonas nasturtii TaxID=1843581 RepID=A0A3E1KDM0_9XANT|nr:hypothetical protein DZD52_20930 [Xanthomonas nasturtii]